MEKKEENACEVCQIAVVYNIFILSFKFEFSDKILKYPYNI